MALTDTAMADLATRSPRAKIALKPHDLAAPVREREQGDGLAMEIALALHRIDLPMAQSRWRGSAP